ncbi:MAG: NAD(+)/NADH kinase [Ilumatobacteraceae bacterium]
MTAVGIIVNPLAGKDIRRLVSAAGHTPDSTKVSIVRRVVAAAIEAGASRVVLSSDPHHLGARAISGLDVDAEILDESLTGTRADTVGAARRMWKEQVGALVALGGDGTCRDVACGWPDAPLIAISTGTNNVYPMALDATAAGTAAGFVASGAIDVATVSERTKRITVHIDDGSSVVDDLALVDLALVDTSFVGARAVLDPDRVRTIVAAVAAPSSTGLSSIPGRCHPVGRSDPGGVAMRLGPGGHPLRVPLAPGTFTTVRVASIQPLAEGEPFQIDGPGVLAFDGERQHRIGGGGRVTVRVDRAGPLMIDVHRTLHLAVSRRLYEPSQEQHHGD